MVDAGHWKWEDANAAKYLFRWRLKNGIQDLKKARHYLDMLIEAEESNMCSTPSGTTLSDTGD
jgi:major membrane immunogen (membrane-anchored lipoprotein)